MSSNQHSSSICWPQTLESSSSQHSELESHFFAVRYSQKSTMQTFVLSWWKLGRSLTAKRRKNHGH